MKQFYSLLAIFLMAIIIYVLFEDTCELEHFQENSMKCNDFRANNYHDVNDEFIDNSLCTYNNNVICNRPMATNFSDIIFDDTFRCPDNTALNYEDIEYKKDSENKKIPVTESDLINGKYCNEFVNIDQENNYLVKKCENTDVCKYIENKQCRFPMSNIKINSLKGICSSNEEFNGLIMTKDYDVNGNLEDLNEYKLMPNNYITAGPHLTEENSKYRSNLLNLYTILFNNDGSKINSSYLNLWDKFGKIDSSRLSESSTSDTFYNNFIDLNGDIIERKYYNFSNPPKNYYEALNSFKNKNLHISLAVNDSATKYAIGVGETKSEAADIALARCISFIDLEEIVSIFSETFNGNKNILINKLLSKIDLINKNELSTGFFNAIRKSIGFSENEIILNPKSNDDLIKKSDNLKNELLTLNESTLGKILINLTSHKDAVLILNTSYPDNLIDDYKCKIYGKVNERICNIDPEVEDIFKYICIRGLEENKTDPCGILLINEKRYLNLDLDKSFINRCNSCVTTEIKNLCNDNNCNYAAIIGFDEENDKCNLYQDIGSGLQSGNNFIDYNKLPAISSRRSQWVNEKEEILKNDKIDLILNNLSKCSKSYNKCVLYNLNGKESSYNSLY